MLLSIMADSYSLAAWIDWLQLVKVAIMVLWLAGRELDDRTISRIAPISRSDDNLLRRTASHHLLFEANGWNYWLS